MAINDNPTIDDARRPIPREMIAVQVREADRPDIGDADARPVQALRNGSRPNPASSSTTPAGVRTTAQFPMNRWPICKAPTTCGSILRSKMLFRRRERKIIGPEGRRG